MIKISILSALLIIGISGCSNQREKLEQTMNIERDNKSKEFNESKMIIEEWKKRVENINLKPNEVISEVKLTKDIENGLIKNVIYNRENLNTEYIFNYYYSEKKIYKNLTLNNFLNNYIFVNGINFKIKYKNILVQTQNNVYLNLNNLEKENKLRISSVYNSFLPEVYISKDSNLKIEFVHILTDNSDRKIQLKVTNLSKKYIDIDTISLYIDNNIKNIDMKLRLPPNSISDSYNIELPYKMDLYKKVNNLNEGSHEIFISAMYKIDNDIKTFTDKN